MKTIKTDTHLLLVDETADKSKDTWYYNTKNKQLNRLKYLDENDVVIIAASPKLGDLPEFETLPPNTEDDVEKLAESLKRTKYNDGSINKHIENDWQSCWKEGFIDGYTQAKSETMFSLKQVKQAINCAFVFSGGKDENETYQDCEDFCLEQVSLIKKEYEFVVEYEIAANIPSRYNSQPNKDSFLLTKQPKIVNNKIQGTWKEIN